MFGLECIPRAPPDSSRLLFIHFFGDGRDQVISHTELYKVIFLLVREQRFLVEFFKACYDGFWFCFVDFDVTRGRGKLFRERNS